MREGTVINDKTAMLIVMTVFVCVIGLMLACGPKYKLVWDKPGGTTEEFSQAKYACMQEAQQRQSAASGAYCTGYGCVPGQAQSKVVMNEDLYRACMEARGWTPRKEKQQ